MTSVADAQPHRRPFLITSDVFERDTLSEEGYFLSQFSSLPRLTSCNDASRCKHRFCPSCAYGEARRQVHSIRDQVKSFPHAVMVTLTLPVHEEVLRGVLDFKQVRAAMKKKIRSYGVPAWLESMELTASSTGWHPHTHIVLLGHDAEVLQQRAEAIVDAWIEASVDHGHDVSARAQSIDAREPLKAASYAMKSKMGTGPSSLGYMLQQAARGDADAAERWAELEDLFRSLPRLRWRQSYGLTTPAVPPAEKRQQGTPTYGAHELAPFALVNLLGITDKPTQQLLLGVNRSKVVRLRREFPATVIEQVREQLLEGQQQHI